jgi:hypothetical protein
LSFTDFRVKEGRELSSSNMAKIKIAHDILAEMGGNDVCTCQGGNSGNLDNDDDENDGATRDYAPLFEALSAQTKAIGDFIEAVKSLGSLEEKQQALQASLKAVEDSVELYNKELAALQIKQKKAVQDVNNLADSVTALKNMPLGDPRALAGRSVTQQLGVVDLKDMLPVNQEHWTLEDCLAQTSKTVKTLGDGTTLTYRHWPSGVGKGLQGEVEGGVRPPLSNAQKTRMSVASRMDYEAGLESFVPVTPNDDLEDILARQR